jgi:hypothetical protein
VEREEGLFGGTSDLDDDNLVSEIERLVQRTKSLRGQVEPSER